MFNRGPPKKDGRGVQKNGLLNAFKVNQKISNEKLKGEGGFWGETTLLMVRGNAMVTGLSQEKKESWAIGGGTSGELEGGKGPGRSEHPSKNS